MTTPGQTLGVSIFLDRIIADYREAINDALLEALVRMTQRRRGRRTTSAAFHRLARTALQLVAALRHGLHPLVQAFAAHEGAQQGQDAGEDGDADPYAQQVLRVGDETHEAVHDAPLRT